MVMEEELDISVDESEVSDFSEVTTELPDEESEELPDEESEELPEACVFFEDMIEYHVMKIPFLIHEALVTAKSKLRKEVMMKHSYGYGLFLSVLLDVG